MNVQPIDGVRDTQLQAVEAATRRDAVNAAAQAGVVQSRTDQAGDKSKNKNKDAKPDSADVAAIAKQADEYFQAKGVNLHFKVSDNNQAVQVEVLEEGSEKVICKIPGDDIVKLRESMKRMTKGVRDLSV